LIPVVITPDGAFSHYVRTLSLILRKRD